MCQGALEYTITALSFQPRRCWRHCGDTCWPTCSRRFSGINIELSPYIIEPEVSGSQQMVIKFEPKTVYLKTRMTSNYSCIAAAFVLSGFIQLTRMIWNINFSQSAFMLIYCMVLIMVKIFTTALSDMHVGCVVAWNASEILKCAQMNDRLFSHISVGFIKPMRLS